MSTRLVALTAAAILLTSPAFATTYTMNSETVEGCSKFVAFTKQLIDDDSDVGDKARAEIDKLLARMQDECNASRFAEAYETAALIRGMNATE